MKRLLVALALLLLPTVAFGQCNGVFPTGTVCGNVTGSSNLPRPTSTASFGLTPGGLSGNVQFNNGSGGLGGYTNTQLTALINTFTSLLSGAVPASGGGTTTFLRADGAFAVPLAAGWGITYSAPTVSISTTQPPYGYDVPINLGLTSSVAASALTITLTGANGSVPSATNPVSIPFRSGTLATGTPNWTAITSTLSVVIPSTATLGTSSSNVPFRIWIFASYNAGTPQLGVATCSGAAAALTTIYPCTAWEFTRVTSTTISAGSTALGTLYATTGVANDPVRIIGYCDYGTGLATAGTWASACTTLQLMGPGIKKPGEIVQTVVNSTSIVGTTASAVFAALATGQTQAITPSTSPNLIRITAAGGLDDNTNGSAVYMQIARGTTLIGQPVGSNTTAATFTTVTQIVIDKPGVATSTTYSIYGRIVGGGQLSYPVTNTGAVMILDEIMG